MREKERRRDAQSAAKFEDVRKMMTAFGSSAAKRFGEDDFLDPDLLRTALSHRYERRQRLRRSVDRLEGADRISCYR